MHTLGLLSEPGQLGLATDLYQLTMAAAYLENGIGHEQATFELFVRRFPGKRSYLIAAGLEQAVEYLQGIHFDGASVDYLRSLPVFSAAGEAFWEYLRAFRFTGDVDAIPEGTVVFPNEPLLRVTGPLIEAQMIETFLLATINHQTLIASKAARVVEAAAGKAVVDFGVRRAHGFDSGLFGTRAAIIGGCVGTSNVLAAQRWGLDLYGTAAHSFTMAFERESEAFDAFHRVFPNHTTLLIDTYNTLEGARRATQVEGPLRGVRLDSGDFLELSREVRKILDEAGRIDTTIVASGDLEENKIAALLAAGAPIDVFGVGTEMITSRDAPALSGVYKLVAIEDDGETRPVRKLSPGKSTYPSAKQVYRTRGADGLFQSDTLALLTEELPGEPLLQPCLRVGAAVGQAPSITEIRSHAQRQRASLPAALRALDSEAAYPVEVSAGIKALIASMNPGAA